MNKYLAGLQGKTHGERGKERRTGEKILKRERERGSLHSSCAPLSSSLISLVYARFNTTLQNYFNITTGYTEMQKCLKKKQRKTKKRKGAAPLFKLRYYNLLELWLSDNSACLLPIFLVPIRSFTKLYRSRVALIVPSCACSGPLIKPSRMRGSAGG